MSQPDDGLFYNRTLEQELFVEAASTGDVQKFRTLISHIAEERRDARQFYEYDQAIYRAFCYDALQFAAQNGHAEIVWELLVFAINSECWDLWAFKEVDAEHRNWQASRQWYSEIGMHKWYFYGARMTSSPFHLAVREGHLPVVGEFVRFFQSNRGFKEFVSSGARHQEWNAIGREWFQGLVEWAVRWGHADILKLLLTHEPLIVPLGDDAKKIPVPLHLAAHHNHLEVLHLALQNIDLPHTFEVLLGAKVDGLTVLHLSAHSGSVDLVKFLVPMIDVNSRSHPELFTALHVAADSGNLNVVQLLLQSTRNLPDHAFRSAETNGWNVDVLARDCMGRTALHYAARQGHEAVVGELLNCSLEIYHESTIASIVDHDGLLALHMAARSGHARVIEKLISMSHDGTNYINHRTKHSLQVKNWVEKEYMKQATKKCSVYHGETYRFPRPKLFDSLFFQTRGFTPSHFAARYGHEEALRQLLKAGSIDLQARDQRGFSAYDWMEVQDKGKVYLKCLVESEAVNGRHNIDELVEALQQAGYSFRKETSNKALMHITSDINGEKEAMEDMRNAWGSSCPPQLTTIVVGWLEEEEKGRVIMDWLLWAARKGNIELIKSLLLVMPKEFGSHKAVNEALVIATDIGDAAILKELLLHLPAGITRARAANKALLSALKHFNFVTAKEIVWHVPEAVAFDELHEVAKMVEWRLFYYFQGTNPEVSDFVVALVVKSDSLPSSLLRKLLSWSSKEPKLRRCGLVEVLLDRPEVKKGLYEDRRVYLDCANAILVGAALIAGLAFQGWLQPPLGYNYTYEGVEYADVHKWAVRLFWRFNNGAFFLSVGSLIASAKGAVPVANNSDMVGSVEKAKRAVAVASTLLGMALVCVVVAFSMAQMAVLPPISSDLQIMRTSVIWGGVLCGLALLWFFFSVLPLLLSIPMYFLSRLRVCVSYIESFRDK